MGSRPGSGLGMALSALLGLFTTGRAAARQIAVRDSDALKAAVRRLRPGDEVVIAPGRYRPGVWIERVAGTAEAPIVIRGRDPKQPPVFEGGTEALHLSDCAHLRLRDIIVRGCSGNGINIDDGGTFETPAHHITLENVTIEDTGPRGNHDGLKLSGLDNFTVRGSRFAGWGGSAIDMVGCHEGVIESCRFEGKDGFSQSTGIQMKGGSRSILIRTSFFLNAGGRAVNLGGSTGLKYFRPQGVAFEAEDITVAGNRFVGGMAPVAFVNSRNGRVLQNTIFLPEKWVLRILQEMTGDRFPPCRSGVFERNLVVFDKRVSTFVNVGPGTAPETFVFRGNAWYHVGGRARPRFPTPEREGVYQVNPMLEEAGTPRMRARSRDHRLKGIGADAYAGSGSAETASGAVDVLGRPIPPLELPKGRQVRVSTADALRRAVEGARRGDVVLVADGEYRVGRLIYMRGRRDVTIYGASKDPTKVVIRGRGWAKKDDTDDILRIGDCENVTIAHVTFRDCQAYALKVEAENNPRNISVHNCHFYDFGTRGIKGSAGRTGAAAKGSVRWCHFENTRVPPADWRFGGDYVTSIDMMALDGWTFADNVFRNVKGRRGGARGAIFVWVRSRDIVIERNLIVDCDRGIALGNPSGSTARTAGMRHVTDAVCRNNMIKTGRDAGIELAWVANVRVYSNTIWRSDARGRGIRCIRRIGRTEIFNNIVKGRIDLVEEATQSHNLVDPPDAFFVDPAKGDLRLTRAAARAVNAARRTPDLKDDFFGSPRDARPDIGCVEFEAKRSRAAPKP